MGVAVFLDLGICGVLKGGLNKAFVVQVMLILGTLWRPKTKSKIRENNGNSKDWGAPQDILCIKYKGKNNKSLHGYAFLRMHVPYREKNQKMEQKLRNNKTTLTPLRLCDYGVGMMMLFEVVSITPRVSTHTSLICKIK